MIEFVLTPDTPTPLPIREPRALRVARWMLEHRVLSRAEVFRACPDANHSAGSHRAALRHLHRNRHIIKDAAAGIWVWRR